jgi:hypothetical protein
MEAIEGVVVSKRNRKKRNRKKRDWVKLKWWEKKFYCEKHDHIISCELCKGIYHGDVEGLASRIADHEVRGKLINGSFQFELIEYGIREGHVTWARSIEYEGGRQEVARWVEVDKGHWYREKIDQKGKWIS